MADRTKKARPRKHWEFDRDLVRACRRGDESAWRTLVFRYHRLVFSIARAHELSTAESEDVLQHVMLALFENLDRLREETRLAGWLSTTARRECLARARSLARVASLEDDAAVAGERPELAARIDRMGQDHALTLALETLETPCRELLTALYVEHPTPSYREIGRRLERPVGSLGPTRARCLEKLKKAYLRLGGTWP